MKDIFTSFDDEREDDDKISRRISFDDNRPEQGSDVFTFGSDEYEDFDTGRNYEEVNFVNEPFYRPSGEYKPSSEDFYGRTGSQGNNFFRQTDGYGNPDASDYVKDRNSYPDDEPYNDYFYDIPHESTDDEFEKNAKAPKNRKSKGMLGMRKKVTKKAVITSVICIILALILALSAFAFSLCSKTDYQPDTHKENEFISENELMSDKKVINILVIGTDKRASQASYRSDTMILVSLDKKNKKVKLTSFLRDSYVYIPAKDYSTKLNASCAYGGPQMVIDTIEYNFKVHIDKYVMIDFNIFKTIIRDLGGVTLTMTEEEAACIRRESGHECKAGTHNYRATLALWYARIRHLDSDFKRTERQRKVIAAVVDKMKKSSPSTLIKMMNDVFPLIQTDLSSTELFKIGVTALPFLSYDIEEMQIPSKGTWSNAYINGQAVLKLDLEENTRLLKEFIYG
ncbi:MAG: LCP family protein [Acutalibacteraceae bacterium]